MRRFTLLAAAAVAALAAFPVGAATGVPTLSEASARFPDRAYGLTLPQVKRLSTADVTVTENGDTVNNLAVIAPGQAGTATILVIDASNSMAGAPIQEAMKAARAFAARRNPSSPLGVVFFNDKAAVALSPTRNKSEISQTLASPPKLREGTHIYDGVSAGVDELRALGAQAGSIVVLSDGADVRSTVSQETAVRRLKDGHVRAFTVGLRSPDYSPQSLQALAAGTGGSYAEAKGSKGLAPIFSALGFKLSNEYLLLWRSLEGPHKNVAVAVKVAGYPAALKTSYTTPTLGLTVEPYSKSLLDRVVESWAFMVLIAFAVVVLLAWGVRTIVTARQESLRRRMSMFVEVDGAPRQHPNRDMAAVLSDIDRSLERRGGFFHRFAEQCEIASIETSPTVLLLGSLVLGFVAGAVLAALLTPWALALAIALPMATVWWVRHQLRRVRKDFAEQLPDNLEVLAASLRAGHSLVGGLQVMADDAAEPSRKEFRRVVTDEQLGIPLEETLRRVGVRMANRDMDQVALIALLQRETGGSSAEVIDQVTENIRGRMEVRRLVRTLTAQGRLARWIVSLMPVFLICAIYVIFPDYLDPLFNRASGIAAVVVATIMVIAGSLVIKRIVEIKV